MINIYGKKTPGGKSASDNKSKIGPLNHNISLEFACEL
jgi:hypothetical protein